ncbi:MAG: hypothetical protein HYZ69_02560 [Candidatus Colwellbacteria bacterium]|nr:hypothetical protein [Candidatus Colwellbacteria bacterium]
MHKYLIISGNGVLGVVESASPEDACKTLGVATLKVGPGDDDTVYQHSHHGYIDLVNTDELPKFSYSYELDRAEPVFQVR